MSRGFQLLRLLLLVLGIGLSTGCRKGASLLDQIDDARQITAALRLQFNQAADASNRAVLAGSDQASTQFAREAQQATRGIEADVAALRLLLQHLGYEPERQTLARFESQFAEYRKVDRKMLDLAVENTNHKAQSLSFGPAREAADEFQRSLQAVASAVAAKDRCRADGLVGRAVLAVRDIQVMQAPHIAEADENIMTVMERDMAVSKSRARSAIDELSPLTPASARAELAAAAAALDRFDGIHAQLLGLSRRNSNVDALKLALGPKPPLRAACDDSLRALQEALGKDRSKATR